MDGQTYSYLCWALCDEWGRPQRWGRAHIICTDQRGRPVALCGVRIPSPSVAEIADEHDADGFCKRCEKQADSQGIQLLEACE